MAGPKPVSPEREQSPSFVASLEERARNVVPTASRPARDFSATWLIAEQVALTLDQLDQLRRRGRELGNALLEAECDVETELMQMEQRTPRYSPYRYPEREKLQRRLARLAEEGRRLVIAQAEKLDSLQERLLSLLQKHRQLE